MILILLWMREDHLFHHHHQQILQQQPLQLQQPRNPYPVIETVPRHLHGNTNQQKEAVPLVEIVQEIMEDIHIQRIQDIILVITIPLLRLLVPDTMIAVVGYQKKMGDHRQEVVDTASHRPSDDQERITMVTAAVPAVSPVIHTAGGEVEVILTINITMMSMIGVTLTIHNGIRTMKE